MKTETEIQTALDETNRKIEDFAYTTNAAMETLRDLVTYRKNLKWVLK